MDVTSGAVWVAAISGVVQIIQSFLARSSRDRQHVETTSKLEEVAKGVDGQTTALLKVTGDAQRAAGRLEGKAEEKAESLL
jgi:hypothetical protein